MEIKRVRQRIILLLTTCMLGLTLSACSSSDNEEPPTQGGTPTRDDLQGVWEQTGYGFVLKIENESAEFFEFTRAGCIQTEIFGSEILDVILDTSTISSDKMSLDIMEPAELFSKTYIKRTALPEFCHPDKRIEDSTPRIVFDHFWHTFNDYYAFFTERQVDWEAQRAIYRPQVSDDLTDQQLFGLLSQMIDSLDDGHVSLVANTDNFESDFSPQDNASVFKAELTESFNQQVEFDDIDDYLEFQLERARMVSFQLVNNLKQAGPTFGREVPAAIYWGILDNNVGYINITRMTLFDETFDIANGDLDIVEDIKALNEILDEVIADLQDTRAMVIDVRSNTGGTDSESMEIINRFATDRLRVISKFARSFNGETEIKQAITKPVSNPYTSPIVVLSSLETASAAEIFLMAINSLSNVTLIGDESTGELSDILDKDLPNGWELGLSNEVYSDFQDRRFEVSGVPMDIKVKALSFPDIEQGIDTALNEALASF